jgi:WD40 repeat protein
VAQTNHVVEILGASTGAIITRLAGHTDRILALEFSSEGSRLLTGSADQSVRCWRIPSGDLDCPPLQHDRGIDRLAFSPNGHLVATAASEAPAVDSRCWIQTWDIRDGRAVGRPIDAGLWVNALFFDPSGRRLFSNCENETQVRVWEAETHRAIEPSLQMWSVVRSWHFSADGTHLVVGSEDGIARIWRLDSGERKFPFLPHTAWVECVQFSPDGTRLLTTSDDCTAKIWDLRTVQSGQTLRLSAAVVASDFHPEGSELLVALADRTIRRIRSDKLIEIGEPLPAPGGAASSQVQFDAAGRQWAAARFADTNSPSSAVGLWRQEDGHLRYLELNQAAAVRGFAFDATGAKLVTEATNHTASLWNTKDGSVVRNVVLPAGSRLHLEFGRGVGGWTVVLQLDGQRFQLYDLETGRLVGQPFQDAIELYDVRFSPDRKRFATAGTSQCGRIWDARTGEPLTPPFKHGGDLLSIAWSPDGRRVVTAGLADDLKLWDAATGARLLSPMPMSEHLAGAEFSSDGRFLVAVDVQRFVRVWDAATAEPITPPWREDDSIANVFLTDDLRLITVTTQGTVRTRRLQANDMNAAVLGDFACFVAGRRLNNAGALLPLKPEELAELNRSLRTRAPQLFKRP